MLKNMGAASIIHIDVLWWWNTLKGRPPILHTYFYKKGQGGGGGGGENFTTKLHPHQRPFWVKNDVSSTLLYIYIKKVKNIYYKKMKKEREKKREKERQDGFSFSEPFAVTKARGP